MLLTTVSSVDSVSSLRFANDGETPDAPPHPLVCKDNALNSTPRIEGDKKKSLGRRVFSSVLDITAYGLLFLPGAVATPGALKVVNHTLQCDCIGIAAKPSGVERKVESREIVFDGFLSNFEDLKCLTDSCKILDLDPNDFDLNKNGVILDSIEEVNLANKLLDEGYKKLTDKNEQAKVKKAISFLNNYKLLSAMVWGEDGPTPNNISQNGEPNCQTMSALKGLFLTGSNIQDTKGRVRISSFKLTGEAPYINFEVFVTGKWVPISYQELGNASCPEGHSASGSKDNSLFVSLFKVACNKASEATIPNWWFSNSSTILADKDYIPMFLLSLSDDEMRAVFSKAPEKIVTVAGRFNLGDIKNGMAVRQRNWSKPVVSAKKVDKFDATLANRAKTVEKDYEGEDNQLALLTKEDQEPSGEIFFLEVDEGSDETISLALSSFPPSGSKEKSQKPSTTEPLPASSVGNGHVYVVESFDEKTDTLMVSDAHGDNVQLCGMDEIRSNLSGVICDQGDIGTFTNRSFPICLMLGSLGYVYYLGKRSMQRT